MGFLVYICLITLFCVRNFSELYCFLTFYTPNQFYLQLLSPCFSESFTVTADTFVSSPFSFRECQVGHWNKHKKACDLMYDSLKKLKEQESEI